MLDRVVCKVEIDPLDGRSLKITALDPYEASPLIVEEPEEVTLILTSWIIVYMNLKYQD